MNEVFGRRMKQLMKRLVNLLRWIHYAYNLAAEFSQFPDDWKKEKINNEER